VSSGVVEVGAGFVHSCILVENQDVKCSGRDNYGNLGDGAGDSTRATFSTVYGLPSTSTISVGNFFSCAMLVEDASVWCWGSTGFPYVFAPVAATELNSGSANIQLVASWSNTYVK
jgi:alpha-tubulin suppressor-like RCC1 family protein